MPALPTEPKIAGELRRLTAADGWSLGARVWRPAEPVATLVFSPAMGASTRAYQGLAAHLCEAGIATVLADPRGVGESGPIPRRGVDFSMWDRVDYDLPAFADLARSLEAGPLFLGGHSLGGQLSLLAAGKHPFAPAGLLAIAACALDLEGWSWPARPVVRGVYMGFAALAKSCGYLPGHRVGWGRPCAKTLTLEWSRWGREGRYSDREGRSAEPLFESVTAPTLVLSFTDDARYAPEAAVRRLAQRLVNAPVEVERPSPAELGCEALGHFAWRGQPAAWARIAGWILTKAAEHRSKVEG